jgi:hypothetical protein
MRSIPILVFAVDEILPCRQLHFIDIGPPSLNPTTVFDRIGTNDLYLCHFSRCVFCHRKPSIPGHLQRIH